MPLDTLSADAEAIAAHATALPAGARVVAAMSGGVDSTVTAALLKRAGYDVVGVTLQLYDHGAALAKKGACCAGQDIHDARTAAEGMGVPHYVLDYESRFREAVMEDFADAYLRGETPIPCIRCNQTVKFRDLAGVAREMGAAALATGHYVRRIEGPRGPELHRAVDPSRDQSYFLFATTRDQLEVLRFPLGDLPKAEVRRVAAELGLKVADKPDSQDICFVPEGRYTTIVDRLRPQGALPGDIVHMDGRVLGRHEGITRYTVGQRRGLAVAVGEPLFVVRLDADRREVIVGPREALLTASLTLKETNWLGDQPTLEDAAAEGLAVLARVRSTAEPVPARLAHAGRRAGGGVRRARGRRLPRPGLRALRPGDRRCARARRRVHRGNDGRYADSLDRQQPREGVIALRRAAAEAGLQHAVAIGVVREGHGPREHRAAPLLGQGVNHLDRGISVEPLGHGQTRGRFDLAVFAPEAVNRPVRRGLADTPDLPPGRTSISSTTLSPAHHHRPKTSASVSARHTCSRGASKARVSTMTRSPISRSILPPPPTRSPSRSRLWPQPAFIPPSAPSTSSPAAFSTRVCKVKVVAPSRSSKVRVLRLTIPQPPSGASNAFDRKTRRRGRSISTNSPPMR